MDTALTDLHKAKDLIDKSRDILIVTHEKPTHDSIGSSLALYLGLTAIGKHVTVACPDPVTVEHSGFVGVNKMVTEVARKNFVISLDYVEGSIEKVSYNIEGDKFNLVIEPRPGFEPFSRDKVHFSNTGTAANLIIAVDTIHVGGLKKLYESDTDLFNTQPVINVDRHPNNANYGKINLVDAQSATTAEVVSQLLSTLGVRLTQDIATNILNALYQGTSDFRSPQVTGRTFDLAAACIKAGGRRFSEQVSRPQAPRQDAAPQVPSQQPAMSQPQHEEAQAVKPPQADKKPEADKQPAAAPVKPEEISKEPPEDWLKPKIFKSSQNS